MFIFVFDAHTKQALAVRIAYRTNEQKIAAGRTTREPRAFSKLWGITKRATNIST